MGDKPAPVRTVVIISGSKSDNSFTQELQAYLRRAGIESERRIASAHRTPTHLEKVLNSIEKRVRLGEEIIVVTVAGMSDGLSGAVAARGFVTVACPPDAMNGTEQEQHTKRWSSTNVPAGHVYYAESIPIAVNEIHAQFNVTKFAELVAMLDSSRKKREEVMMADAALQGVARPLPHTWVKNGKIRRVYDVSDSELILECSDDISAFEAKAPNQIPGKGKYLNLLSAWWFEQTKGIVDNHFIRLEGDTAMRVKKTDRINVEWIVRERIYGSMWRKYVKGQREFYDVTLPDGLQMGDKLPQPMVTPTTKEERKGYHDAPISKEKAIENGLVTAEEWDTCVAYTLKLYEFYRQVADKAGFILPDFKVEYGRLNGKIIQIDEAPTHDSARMWNASKFVPGPQEAWCFDKEWYRQLLMTAYHFNEEGKATELPEVLPAVMEQIELRARAFYEILVQGKSINDYTLRSVEDVAAEIHSEAEAWAAAHPEAVAAAPAA